MKKTKVFLDQYKGSNLFAIWAVDENGNKLGEYPIVSFGSKKAKAIIEHLEDLKEFTTDTLTKDELLFLLPRK